MLAWQYFLALGTTFPVEKYYSWGAIFAKKPYIHIFLCCSWSYSQLLITAVFAKKGNIFITFPSFENSHYFSSNAVYASGQIAMQCRIVMTKYADPQFSIVFANSASNSKFKQKSAWSFYQVFIVQSGNPLPLLKCQRLKLGQVMWRRPQTNGTLLFHCGLDHFPRKEEFQPVGVVEPQSWRQGIHIVKVDLSSNRCFRCWHRLRWKSHHAL